MSPAFKSLSLGESLILQLSYVLRGLQDAFRWNLVISTVLHDVELRGNILKSAVVNLLTLVFIFMFDLFILPLLHHQPDRLHHTICWIYQALWLFPVVSISLYFNNIWCSTVARRAYVLKYGSSASALLLHSSSSYTGVLNALSSSSYRVIMIFTCLAASSVLSHVPFIGSPANLTFFCWIDAYYCFEFAWIARGMSLSKRAAHIEERWAYYFAFGLPLTVLCSWGTNMTNAASFALLFPAYIILAIHANPVPLEPYMPIPSHYDDPEGILQTPILPVRLPIFTPILWLNDRIMLIFARTNADHRITCHREPFVTNDTDAIEEGIQSTDANKSFARRQVIQNFGVTRRKLD